MPSMATAIASTPADDDADHEDVRLIEVGVALPRLRHDERDEREHARRQPRPR